MNNYISFYKQHDSPTGLMYQFIGVINLNGYSL